MKNFLAITLISFFAFGMAIVVQEFMAKVDYPLLPIMVSIGVSFYIGYGVGCK